MYYMFIILYMHQIYTYLPALIIILTITPYIEFFKFLVIFLIILGQ